MVSAVAAMRQQQFDGGKRCNEEAESEMIFALDSEIDYKLSKKSCMTRCTEEWPDDGETYCC